MFLRLLLVSAGALSESSLCLVGCAEGSWSVSSAMLMATPVKILVVYVD